MTCDDADADDPPDALTVVETELDDVETIIVARASDAISDIWLATHGLHLWDR